MKNLRGMSVQLLRLLMLAGICAVSLFMFIHLCTDPLISKFFSGSALQMNMIGKRIEHFERYISQNDISATDAEALMKWCDKQPMVLMEIYRDNILYYNSNYVYEDPLIDQNIEMPRYSWYSYYKLQFADGPADVLVYSDESYILNTWITVMAVIFSGVLFLIIVLTGIRKTIRYIYLLCDEIQIMGMGDLEQPVTVKGNNELGLLAAELDQMRSALCLHRQKEKDMIRQNNDMITCLSHDLRTPLTKLMLYTEIIQKDRCTDKEQLDKYLVRIHEKSLQMKEISDHLLKYSLSPAMAEAPIMQTASFHAAFFDCLSELTDYLSEQGFTVQCDIDWAETEISYNELYLNHIMDNIVSNIDKYAEKIRSVYTDHFIGISIKNNQSICYDCTDSNGVGIESIRTMMRQMNGRCTVEQTETVFEITLLYDRECHSAPSFSAVKNPYEEI